MRPKKKAKRGLLRTAALSCGALAIPGLASAASFEPADCPFEQPAGQIQGETLNCGFLVVPEDRDDPASRSIRLAVAIFENPTETSADPIVYLSGGPGGSALELVRFSFNPVFAPLFATGRDIILFDQRGIGVSQPALDCPAETFTLDEWLACADTLRASADLSDYHTASNAADVDDLRRALGYEQVNLWGGSYGTRLALDVIRDHPDGLRSVVLDAVYPPDVDLIVDTPANVDRAFQHLFAACAADATCDAAFPDLGGTLLAAVARMNAEPATVQLSDPIAGGLFDATLSGTDLTAVLFQFLYATELLGELPKMIHDAAEGRYDVIESYLGSFVAQGGASSRGMQYSVLCHDEIVFSSKALYEAAAGAFPLLVPVFQNSVLGGFAYDVCDGWGAGRADDIENVAVSSEVPTLLLTGEFDPITPPGWTHHAGTTLSNGRVFQFPAVGHGASPTSCGRSLMLAFIVDPAAALNSSCIDELSVRWSLPSTGVTATSRRLDELQAHLAMFPPAFGIARGERERQPER